MRMILGLPPSLLTNGRDDTDFWCFDLDTTHIPLLRILTLALYTPSLLVFLLPTGPKHVFRNTKD